MDSRQPLHVAFLGTRHPHVFPRLAICRETPGVEIVGLYDDDPDVARAISEREGVPAADRPEALLGGGAPLDLVVIEGHEPQNPRYVELAAPRARALLIEKPGAPDLSGMERIVKTVERAGIHAQIGYMYAYSPVVARVGEILESGALGPVTLARFHAAAPVGCAAEIWQSLPEDMGGAFFTDGCHMMDLVVHLLGEPRAAHGRLLRLPGGPDAPEVVADVFKKDILAGLGSEVPMRLGGLVHEDAAAAILEYDHTIATFDVTGWEAHNWVEAWSMEFYGTDGTLHVSLVPPGFSLWIRREHAGTGFSRGWHTWRGTGTAEGAAASLVPDETYRNEMADLFSRLRDGRPPDLARLREGLAVVRVMDMVYRSARAT